VTEDDSNLVLSTMKAFENDLSKFVRVHKSYIINIDKVERFNSKFAEIGVTKIPLSRNKRRFSKSTFLCVTKYFNKIDIYTTLIALY
jgi:DNA-binding LytR/AlgR family response regulator